MNFIWAEHAGADSWTVSGLMAALGGWQHGQSRDVPPSPWAQLSRQRIITCDEFYAVSVCDLSLDTVGYMSAIGVQLGNVGECSTLVDEEMAVSLGPCLSELTPMMMTSSRASSEQADCDELYQSHMARPDCTGRDYVKEVEESSRMTAEEGEEEEEEDDGDLEGEDAEAMYNYFMSRQSGDADNNNVTVETMAADLKDCNNVKLKTIENTKVAVAQFAENNLAPTDFLMLQSTLYNLQQQQLFQLQLLQQIQQQLVSGVSPTMIANLRQLTAHPASSNPMVIPPLLPMSNVMSVMSSGSGPLTSGPLTSVTSALSSYNDRESKYTMAHHTPSTSLSMSPLKMLSSLKTPSAITTPTADLLPLPHTSAVTSSGSDSSQFGK
ncbi:hypothetical protein LSAT2_032645, partial [Lamellibrachia satsuma]